MRTRRPETLAFLVALAGTLTIAAVFLADLVLARHRDIESGERRLQHFSIMMAEHTARTFEAVDVLLRETATDLSTGRHDWETWDANKGWEYIAQRHSRAMPQLRDLIIFDRLGNQRFISTQTPAAHINVKDRPYFMALEQGAEASTYGPYVGRNSGRYTYAIARRLNSETGKFSGAVFSAIEPSYLQDFCWPNRLADDFETVLINTKGEIIASCRPTDLSRQSPILGAKASTVLFNGKLRNYMPASGEDAVKGLLISVSPVPGFSDLRILSAIPEKSLLAAWKNRLFELSALGLLVTAVMFVGAMLFRRQLSTMANMTDELQASQEHLGERVREATQEIAGQKDAAERANAAKSRFLAAASHDLRQPLHALSLFSADLQRQVRGGSPHGLPRLADQISASTTMLGELLDSILDISRLDVSGIKPDIRPFQLQPLFDRLTNSFRRSATDRHITLRFRATSLWVSSDGLLLERMIANLVSNAVRYTHPGGRVLVTARRRGPDVLIEVRDNGIGIAKADQAAIFGEFFQVGNAAREHNKGLGLGLSIVDRLARALNVQVGLRSRLSEGTTFSLRLAGSPPVSLPRPQEEATKPVGKIHCIGSSEELQACIRLVEGWGYKVTITDSAKKEALPNDALIIADAAFASATRLAQAPEAPLIVLLDDGPPNLPAGTHALPRPVRPAKLRALLNQLQKTLSKSMP